MKNRLKPYFESESKPKHKPQTDACRNLRQFKLITLHRALSQEMEEAGTSARGHYEDLLVSLRRLIESYGPSPDYDQWVNSSHCVVSSQRRGRSLN